MKDSLFNIPARLFSEFRNQSDQPEILEWNNCGTYKLFHSTLPIEGTEGSFTLVLQELDDPQHKRNCRQELGFWHWPVDIRNFHPDDESWSQQRMENSDLLIITSTDDPPWNFHRAFSSQGATWEKGKGYWVTELSKMVTRFGTGTHLSSNDGEDFVFEFIIHLLNRMYELQQETPQRGHWQSEWNPDGDYSEKFELEGR
jgi:hypothetical protein